jgi:hypothetical protein
MDKSDDAQQTYTQSKDAKTRPQRIYIQRVQNVPLDNNVTQLCRVVNDITTFTNADQCIDFLTNIYTEKVCILISGSLCQSIIPLIHDITQLHTIFIFCPDQTRHEQWANEWPKIKGVFTEISPIWWYTCESFLYSMLNCSLRLMNMDIIIKMAFFTGYRGQGMSITDFDQMIKIQNGLMSFNNFFSFILRNQ